MCRQRLFAVFPGNRRRHVSNDAVTLPTDNVNAMDESLQHPIPSGPIIVLEESTVNESLPSCCHDDPVQGCTDAELEVGDFEFLYN